MTFRPTHLLLPLACAISLAQSPVRSVTDPGVVTTRQSITPAGVPAIFEGKDAVDPAGAVAACKSKSP